MRWQAGWETCGLYREKAVPPAVKAYYEAVGPCEGGHGIALSGDGAEMVVAALGGSG